MKSSLPSHPTLSVRPRESIEESGRRVQALVEDVARFAAVEELFASIP